MFVLSRRRRDGCGNGVFFFLRVGGGDINRILAERSQPKVATFGKFRVGPKLFTLEFENRKVCKLANFGILGRIKKSKGTLGTSTREIIFKKENSPPPLPSRFPDVLLVAT